MMELNNVGRQTLKLWSATGIDYFWTFDVASFAWSAIIGRPPPIAAAVIIATTELVGLGRPAGKHCCVTTTERLPAEVWQRSLRGAAPPCEAVQTYRLA